MRHPLVIVTKSPEEAQRESKRFVQPCIRYCVAVDLYLVYESVILAEGGEDSVTFSV